MFRRIVAPSLPAELFERYAPMVFRRCRRLLGDEDAAHDATQEVFLRALVKQAEFRGNSSPQTWLYRIATTYCLQQLRNHKRRESKLRLLAGETKTRPVTIDDQLLWQCILDDLDPVVQQLALHRHVDGLSLEEVAEVSGLSRKTVSKKLDVFADHARRAFNALGKRGSG